MSEKVRIVVNPEKMEAIKQKYSLDDVALKELLSGVSVVSIDTGEESQEEETGVLPQSRILQKIGGGELTLVEYLALSDMQDRRDERKVRREREEQGAKVTPETIAVAVAKALKDAGISSPENKPKDEMPGWAKNQGEQLQIITNKLAKEEEEKRLQQTITAAVKPLEEKLAKTEEKLAETTKELEKPKTTPKGELETTKDTLKVLSEIDDLRGKGEGLPPGTPGEITVATKTLDKGEKVLTTGMKDVKDTVSEVLEFQLEREKHMYRQQAPKLQEIPPEEKRKTLEAAVGEQPASPPKK